MRARARKEAQPWPDPGSFCRAKGGLVDRTNFSPRGKACAATADTIETSEGRQRGRLRLGYQMPAGVEERLANR